MDGFPITTASPHNAADDLSAWMDINVDCSFGFFVNDLLACTEDHIDSEVALVRFSSFAVSRLRRLLFLPFSAWRNICSSDGICLAAGFPIDSIDGSSDDNSDCQQQ